MKPNINKIQRLLKKRKVLSRLILVMPVLIQLFLKGLKYSKIKQVFIQTYLI